MENEKEMEIDLRDIFYLLLSKLPFIILITVIATIAGFAYAKMVMPVKYTSSVSIYVNNANENAMQEQDRANAADIQASKALASTYIVILNDDIVYDEVSEMLFEEYDIRDLEKVFTVAYNDSEPYISANQIRSLVSISSVNDTEVIQITATTENASLAADICTNIAEIAPELLTRVTKAGSVETIGYAKVPTAPSAPNVKRVTAIGMLLGLVLSVAIVIISDLLDSRIKTAEDFKKRFGEIPVLAEIPDLQS
ncbi:MAG: lipopolysaccharide biosynthesis protein [Ruminococcus sp.]|nr:lipopolysaccharide biosynthesis protein [Ruminococcus sp.]